MIPRRWNVTNAEGFESTIRKTDEHRLIADQKLTWLFPTSSFHKCLMFSTPASVVKELPLQMRICKYSYWGTWNKVTTTKESQIRDAILSWNGICDLVSPWMGLDYCRIPLVSLYDSSSMTYWGIRTMHPLEIVSLHRTNLLSMGICPWREVWTHRIRFCPDWCTREKERTPLFDDNNRSFYSTIDL